MADPVTLAMVGAAAGAALKPKDPLKGAMLGATVGFTGGTALGAGAVTAAAPAGGAIGGTGLATGGSALGTTTGLGLAAPTAATSGYGLTAGGGTLGTSTGLGLTAPTAATSGYGLTSAAAAPTFSQQLSGAGTFLKENPMYALQGMNSAQGLLQQEQMPQAPQGQVQRGQPMAPVNFASLLNPQQYKPQPISLLG